MKYEIAILGPDAANRQVELTAALERGIEAMGLDPIADFEVFSDARQAIGHIDWDGAPVAVWCGAETSPPMTFDHLDLQLVREFQNRGNPIFPIMESREEFQKKVPAELTMANGDQWDNLDAMIASILTSLGLIRQQRKAFISYRRAESSGVAIQLFNQLQLRKFDAFLDTASIEAGVHVQDHLNAKLSDKDVLVLLHTAGALDSGWVYSEVVNAQRRGTEILEVRWPQVEARRDLAFSDPFELEESDLIRASDQQLDTLQQPCIDRLLQQIEWARIRSVRNRRDRIVKQVIDDASDAGLNAEFCPGGTRDLAVPHVVLSQNPEGNGFIAALFLSDGTPNSKELYQRHRDAIASSINKHEAHLIYDELGVLQEDLDHLGWLNQSLIIQTIPVFKVPQWMDSV